MSYEDNYEQLKTAVIVLRNYGIPDDVIKKQLEGILDKCFMEGFKAAYDLIDNIFCSYKEPPFDDLWEEIEEEFENYSLDK
jgi:hypothetical protein